MSSLFSPVIANIYREYIEEITRNSLEWFGNGTKKDYTMTEKNR